MSVAVYIWYAYSGWLSSSYLQDIQNTPTNINSNIFIYVIPPVEAEAGAGAGAGPRARTGEVEVVIAEAVAAMYNSKATVNFVLHWQ